MRIDLVKPDEVDESIKDLIPEIIGLRGRFFNLHGAIANSPKALKAFMVFSRYVRDDSDLDPMLRELTILLIGHNHNNPYELVHHRPIARKLGISEEKILAVPAFQTSSLFDAREKAALAYIQQAVNGFRVTDEVFSTLKNYLNETEIIDLSLVLGWYQLCSSILLPLEVEIEQDYQ